MGLGCGKAHLPKEDPEVTGSLPAKELPYSKDEPTAYGKDCPEVSFEDRGKSSRPAPTPKKPAEPDIIGELLKRASLDAAGREERLAAARAAEVENDSDGETDDKFFGKLLGGPASMHSSGPAAASTSASSSADTRPRPASPEGPTKPKAGHSLAVLQASARHGVPLPSWDDEKSYGLLDEYVDDLLGIPAAKRPTDWRRPSLGEIEEASWMGTPPNIVFSDGRRGPPLHRPPRHERIQEDISPSEVPIEPSPSVVPPPGAQTASASSGPFLSGVINGWATIDAGAGQAISLRVAEDRKPAPKKKAGRWGS